jgi:hypothetical protein
VSASSSASEQRDLVGAHVQRIGKLARRDLAGDVHHRRPLLPEPVGDGSCRQYDGTPTGRTGEVGHPVHDLHGQVGAAHVDREPVADVQPVGAALEHAGHGAGRRGSGEGGDGFDRGGGTVGDPFPGRHVDGKQVDADRAPVGVRPPLGGNGVAGGHGSGGRQQAGQVFCAHPQGGGLDGCVRFDGVPRGHLLRPIDRRLDRAAEGRDTHGNQDRDDRQDGVVRAARDPGGGQERSRTTSPADPSHDRRDHERDEPEREQPGSGGHQDRRERHHRIDPARCGSLAAREQPQAGESEHDHAGLQHQPTR